jgi:hypothetical protein
MFVSTLQGPPFDLAIEENPDGGGYLISISVAVDEQTQRETFLICSLEPVQVHDGHYSEFSFAIVINSLDGTLEDFATQDPSIAGKYYPLEIKPSIMAAVCASIAEFCNKLAPELVYFVCKEASLPDPLMVKYFRLTETLLSVGYEEYVNGTDKFGRHFWIMRRIRD